MVASLATLLQKWSSPGAGQIENATYGFLCSLLVSDGRVQPLPCGTQENVRALLRKNGLLTPDERQLNADAAAALPQALSHNRLND